MDIELLQLDEDESLWPALVSEIHGTILCYNAQDRESLKGLDVAIRKSRRTPYTANLGVFN
jgi:hypothetical protein